MAPATRSSAPSTPSRPRVSTGSGGLVTPPSATRRTPHCTKCHRPRAGHPRSGCPYVDASNPPSPSSKPTSRVAQVAPAGDDGISEELSSLHIVSPTEETPHMSRSGKTPKRGLSVRFVLVPEQTLASLSPTDSELVEQLFQPGMMSDDVSAQDSLAQVLRWQKTLHDAEPPKLGGRTNVKIEPEPQPEPSSVTSSSNSRAAPPLSRRMPCTLFTPSLTPTDILSDHGIGGSAVNMNETIYLLPDYDVKRKRPIGRSMSFEQRSAFLQQLSHSSGMAPATLLSFPLADVDSVRSEAEKKGFIVRVLPGQEEDRKWVILGTEEDAISLLAEKFRSEEQRSARAQGRGGKLTAAAGGVVFGAVATWTGLAFS